MNIKTGNSRPHLLATVSTIALVLSSGSALAENGEPVLWAEIGWHSDKVYDSTDGFALPLGALVPQSGLTAPLTGGATLSRSYGDDRKLAFRPDGMDWVFSASIRYGRSHGKSQINQTKPLPTTSFTTFHTTIPTYPFPYHRTYVKPVKIAGDHIDVSTVSAETHFFLDFEAGKDVGLGIFGQGSTSTLGAGVRFAHLSTALNVSQFHAQPDVHFSHFQYAHPTRAFFPSTTLIVPWYHSGARELWHSLAGNPHSSHSFTGLGPSIYWDASAHLWGQDRDGISLDWGMNAALLFGKQKNKVQHHTTGAYNCYGHSCYAVTGRGISYRNQSASHNEKSATVPSLGGYAGFSYRIADVKASFGYRADFFFHAIDTGLTGQDALSRGFYGPFASISIGVGGD